MRLLIYGAGVIGCWYAVLFSKAGYDTTIYARGKRLELLRKEGLRYEVKGKVHKADIKIIGRMEEEDKIKLEEDKIKIDEENKGNEEQIDEDVKEDDKIKNE